MCDPARAKCEHITLTESLKLTLEAKQEDGESLVDYAKKFKQARDVAKDSLGTNMLHGFVEKRAECQATTDATERSEMKAESFNKFMTHSHSCDSDQRKHGSTMKTFKMQCLLGNNQCCEKITNAEDVLTNHTWDQHVKRV